jgi:hypothetical protein
MMYMQNLNTIFVLNNELLPSVETVRISISYYISPDSPVSSTNKTGLHDIAEIVL